MRFKSFCLTLNLLRAVWEKIRGNFGFNIHSGTQWHTVAHNNWNYWHVREKKQP